MITYRRKTVEGKIIKSEKISDVFTNWGEERWLFVAPHDDDIVIGAGDAVLAALENNVEVHCAITTDGSMGYCTPEHKNTIGQVRLKECADSFDVLGVKHVHFLNFPDCHLAAWRGRTLKTKGHISDVAGASGLQNSYVALIRKINPTRIFIPTRTDLHPDHQIVNAEMLISVFHAEGGIWPELGERIPAIPTIYEYAVYTDFLKPPQICLELSDDILEKKWNALRCYKSQTQIELIVQQLKGNFEFIREIEFDFYSPKKYIAEFVK